MGELEAINKIAENVAKVKKSFFDNFQKKKNINKAYRRSSIDFHPDKEGTEQLFNILQSFKDSYEKNNDFDLAEIDVIKELEEKEFGPKLQEYKATCYEKILESYKALYSMQGKPEKIIEKERKLRRADELNVSDLIDVLEKVSAKEQKLLSKVNKVKEDIKSTQAKIEDFDGKKHDLFDDWLDNEVDITKLKSSLVSLEEKLDTARKPYIDSVQQLYNIINTHNNANNQAEISANEISEVVNKIDSKAKFTEVQKSLTSKVKSLNDSNKPLPEAKTNQKFSDLKSKWQNLIESKSKLNKPKDLDEINDNSKNMTKKL